MVIYTQELLFIHGKFIFSTFPQSFCSCVTISPIPEYTTWLTQLGKIKKGNELLNRQLTTPTLRFFSLSLALSLFLSLSLFLYFFFFFQSLFVSLSLILSFSLTLLKSLPIHISIFFFYSHYILGNHKSSSRII